VAYAKFGQCELEPLQIDMPWYSGYYQQEELSLDDRISRRGKLEDVY